MRKFLPILLCLGLACNLLTPQPAPTVSPPALSPSARPETFTPPPGTNTPGATAAAGLTPSAVVRPQERPTASPPLETTPCTFQLAPEDVIVHPSPLQYSGDTLSAQVVISTSCPAWQSATVAVYANGRTGTPLATVTTAPYGLGQRPEATFTWIWDTQNLSGPQTLVVEARPDHGAATNPAAASVVTVTVNLLPASQRPEPEARAQWEVNQSTCCLIHYLSGTAAARDIDSITTQAAEAQDKVKATLGIDWDKPVEFTMLSRLLGHGGFASSSIALTYLDRNPVGNNLFVIFTHEQTHILDQKLAAVRPALMGEGLAVYVAGGHFKPNEDLMQRAAALLELGLYLPLGELADNFYPSQHETGYLEGGALITYLVQTYGWDRFKQFYGSFKSGTDRQMLNNALQINFGKNLDQIEADWLAALRAQPVTPAQRDDVRLTIALYDTLRRYQRLNDPLAYFLTAWVPDTAEAVRRGLVADYVRLPDSPENVALETMLAAAERALEAGQYDRAETLLNSVNAVLDSRNLFFDPLAARYLGIVSFLAAAGYEAQTIELDPAAPAAGPVQVTAIRHWPTLETFTLQLGPDGWRRTD
jgi:hypothetical protein